MAIRWLIAVISGIVGAREVVRYVEKVDHSVDRVWNLRKYLLIYGKYQKGEDSYPLLMMMVTLCFLEQQ